MSEGNNASNQPSYLRLVQGQMPRIQQISHAPHSPSSLVTRVEAPVDCVAFLDGTSWSIQPATAMSCTPQWFTTTNCPAMRREFEHIRETCWLSISRGTMAILPSPFSIHGSPVSVMRKDRIVSHSREEESQGILWTNTISGLFTNNPLLMIATTIYLLIFRWRLLVGWRKFLGASTRTPLPNTQWAPMDILRRKYGHLLI